MPATDAVGWLRPVLGQDATVLYAGEDLLGATVRLTAPDVDAVRRVQPDPDDWGWWLEAALTQQTVVYFSIVAGERLVGEIFLHDLVPDQSEGMVGYHVFDPAERGKGIGRAALNLLLAWVTRETGIQHLYVITRKDNVASRRLVEGAGFSYVGRAREDEDRVVYDWRPCQDARVVERVVLFDGTGMDGWTMAGPGAFELVDGALESCGGMGLLWYSARSFGDFTLDVHWQVERPDDNSGVFVRFPDPNDDPWVAVNEGYEIQIHDTAREPIHQTGGIYSFAAPTFVASNPARSWNHLSIRCERQQYVVVLNGSAVTRFTGDRRTDGFVGLQNHDGQSRVRFRRVEITTG